MMGISEIALLPPGSAAAPLDRNDPKAAAIEFDAMVLELLLKQSGLLRSLGTEEGMESALLGEMLLPNIARQLAAQIDIGFGSLLLNVPDNTSALPISSPELPGRIRVGE